MLGIGRAVAQRYARDAVGRVDLAALERGLQALDGEPAIIIANAGEVNAGEFDPIDAMADLARSLRRVAARRRRLRPLRAPEPAHGRARRGRRARGLGDGRRAQWLNVPFDCGFAFVRDVSAREDFFAAAASTCPDDRARIRQSRARELAPLARVRRLGDPARLRTRRLSRARRARSRPRARARGARRRRPRSRTSRRRAAQHRVLPLPAAGPRRRGGSTTQPRARRGDPRGRARVLRDDAHAGRVAFRPAFVSWRTTTADADLMLETVRDLGRRIV